MFAVMLGSTLLAFTLLTVAFRLAAPLEHQFARDILAPEVVAGTLTVDELDAVVDRKASKAFKKAAPNHRARRARKHLRRAILDLTHDVARSAGAETEGLRHARAEVARLGAVATPGAAT